MLIAADARFFQSAEMPHYSNFTKEVLLHIAAQKKTDSFLFFVDKAVDPALELPANVTAIILTPKPKNYLSYKWWYDVRLPLALKKYKPAIFIGTYGLCSANTSIPQLLIVHDLAFLHKYALHPSHSFLFYKKATPACLKKAVAIATTSQHVKDAITQTYSFSKNKIAVCGSAVSDDHRPVEWNEKESIKAKYTGGCEYFLFRLTNASVAQLILVLKAFSIFKKWQRSNMKLVIITNSFAQIEKEQQKLETYRLRNDIVLHEHLPEAEIITLTAAAYTTIHPVLYDGFSATVLESIRSKSPVIAYDIPAVREVAGDAALYCPPGDPQQMAEQMKLIYKDENLRQALVEKAFEKAMSYSRQVAATIIWNMIEDITRKASKKE